MRSLWGRGSPGAAVVRPARDLGAAIEASIGAAACALLAALLEPAVVARVPAALTVGIDSGQGDEWAVAAALAGALAALALAALDLLLGSAARALGLPAARSTLDRQLLARAPRLLLGLLLAMLLVGLIAGVVTYRDHHDNPVLPFVSIVLGVLLCGPFARAIPRRLARARQALAGRRYVAAVGGGSLHPRPGAGPVRVSGVVIAAGPTLLSSEGPAVCVHHGGEPAAGDRPLSVAVPFWIEDRGLRLLVDPGSGGPAREGAAGEVIAEVRHRPMVIRRHQPGRPFDPADPHTELVWGGVLVGERIEVIGWLAPVDGDAYRERPRRLTAGPDSPLWLLLDVHGVRRRLALAAALELGAAAGAALCLLGLVAMWVHLAELAAW